MKKDVKIGKAVNNFYGFKTYKPNKNAVPVTYKGTHYLSKAQCMALEGITRKELDEYLKSIVEELVNYEVEFPVNTALEQQNLT